MALPMGTVGPAAMAGGRRGPRHPPVPSRRPCDAGGCADLGGGHERREFRRRAQLARRAHEAPAPTSAPARSSSPRKRSRSTGPGMHELLGEAPREAEALVIGRVADEQHGAMAACAARVSAARIISAAEAQRARGSDRRRAARAAAPDAGRPACDVPQPHRADDRPSSSFATSARPGAGRRPSRSRSQVFRKRAGPKAASSSASRAATSARLLASRRRASWRRRSRARGDRGETGIMAMLLPAARSARAVRNPRRVSWKRGPRPLETRAFRGKGRARERCAPRDPLAARAAAWTACQPSASEGLAQIT